MVVDNNIDSDNESLGSVLLTEGTFEFAEQGIIFATTNSSVLLNCSSTDTTIAWYKNNVPISSTPSRTITNEGNLNLSDVQSTEAGWYTCSSAGGLVEDFLLIVGGELLYVTLSGGLCIVLSPEPFLAVSNMDKQMCPLFALMLTMTVVYIYRQAQPCGGQVTVHCAARVKS